MFEREYRVILLAGGQSSRTITELGIPKGLIEDEYGNPWIVKQISQIQKLGKNCKIVAVLGYHAEAYLKKLSQISFPDATSVVNVTPELGPFSSIQTGIRTQVSLSPVFILPLDVPCPNPEVWYSLGQEMGSDIQVCMPLGGGHPVLLSPQFQQNLLECIPTSRLDFQIRSLPTQQVRRIRVNDPKIQMNLNTPLDWADFRAFNP